MKRANGSCARPPGELPQGSPVHMSVMSSGSAMASGVERRLCADFSGRRTAFTAGAFFLSETSRASCRVHGPLSLPLCAPIRGSPPVPARNSMPESGRPVVQDVSPKPGQPDEGPNMWAAQNRSSMCWSDILARRRATARRRDMRPAFENLSPRAEQVGRTRSRGGPTTSAETKQGTCRRHRKTCVWADLARFMRSWTTCRCSGFGAEPRASRTRPCTRSPRRGA